MKKQQIIKKLKPFWVKMQDVYTKFSKEKRILEEEMTKSLNLGIELEFFYVDGECCGIGAENLEDRKKFRLIHDRELY